MRRMILVLAVVTAAGCTAEGAPRSAPTTAAVATVAVERTDLSTTRTLPGTLGYGVPRTIRAAGGTVTWLPRSGATVKRGGTLYRNDDQPVTLLYGSTPLFRPLGTAGLTGRDVRVLGDNLRALGYRTGDQPRRRRRGDAVLTAGVVAAVRKWQGDEGRAVTGTVGPADVVVLPGAVRVSQLDAQLGDPAAEGVLVVTGRRKAVTVPVPVTELGSIRVGQAVRVELPGGGRTPGTVGRIDRDARVAEDSDQAAQVEVTVTLGDAKAVNNLDSAPVDVSFAGPARKNVLAVPVAALLALREGGHAVQIAGGPLVAVETGLFAQGLVEISGEGLAEGVRVVTAS